QGVLRLQLEAAGNSELELWGVARRGRLLEKALGLGLRVAGRAVGGGARGPKAPVRPRRPPPEPPRSVGVVDIGASAIRLTVADARPGEPIVILEEASRGALLGKAPFTHGKLQAATVEATLKAMEGFRRIMDSYGVVRYRAVATSAVREAQNRETFIDRVRLRTGIDVEIIDGSEEIRLTHMAVQARLRGHEDLTSGNAVLAEVGGGSGDISFLRKGEPAQSGTY